MANTNKLIRVILSHAMILTWIRRGFQFSIVIFAGHYLDEIVGDFWADEERHWACYSLLSMESRGEFFRLFGRNTSSRLYRVERDMPKIREAWDMLPLAISIAASMY